MAPDRERELLAANNRLLERARRAERALERERRHVARLMRSLEHNRTRADKAEARLADRHGSLEARVARLEDGTLTEMERREIRRAASTMVDSIEQRQARRRI